MRFVVYLLLAAACAAIPVESVTLALISAENAEIPAADARLSRLARWQTYGRTSVTLADVEDLVDALAEGLSLTLVPNKRADLLLHDGRVLKAACIVAVGETSVTVTHAEGLTDVEIERVPQDEIERAQAEILATAAEGVKIEAEVAARAAERIRETNARMAAELEERFALANARTEAAGSDPGEAPLGPVTDRARRLAGLQRRFPARTKGRNALGIEFDLPPRPVWSFYNSTFQASTLATLSETLAIMEARRTQDLAAWEWRFKSTLSIAQSVEHVQAEQTYLWLSGTLRDFLLQARQVARTR